MRIILSRKGFDSASGGCPSPLIDDALLSLPIPDRHSPVRYADLTWRGRNLGDIVEKLTRGEVSARSCAHLDPDVRADICLRTPGWCPAFGQLGQAQAHLRNQGVRKGDLFLFWGLFSRVDEGMKRIGPAIHALWGWLQVGEVVAVDDLRARLDDPRWRWAARHPHLALSRGSDPSNTLYVAARDLALPGCPVRAGRGAGVLERFEPMHQLTADGASCCSEWSLPEWLHPAGRRPLTYHSDPERWERVDGRTKLRAASRGQEFVLHADEYPESIPWASRLGLG